MGAKLAPSRERGVLVMASGNVVHNLRAMDWYLADKGYDWAKRFDEDAKELILSNPADAAPLEGHTDFRTAVPTPDHFLPWLYLAGMASVATDKPDILVSGYAYGSMSMTAYTLGFVTPAPLPLSSKPCRSRRISRRRLQHLTPRQIDEQRSLRGGSAVPSKRLQPHHYGVGIGTRVSAG